MVTTPRFRGYRASDVGARLTRDLPFGGFTATDTLSRTRERVDKLPIDTGPRGS